MSKRKRTSKIDIWIKEGRGSGIGSDYMPWLKIQDVSSLGRSTRLKGIKTNRQHEFLSDLERNYFYLTEYSDFVIDIREQFPLLPLDETIVIADELGIKHPTDSKTGVPIVMTTDFLLTMDKGQGAFEVARTIKMKDELLKERVLEKFEIEREYWQRRDIDWGIVTEEDIPKTLARNISYIHDYHNIRDYDAFREMSAQHIEDLSLSLIQRLLNSTSSIRAITNEFDIDTQVDWIKQHSYTHVAMENTSVYWKPIVNLLEAEDIEFLVVNAQHMKTVPGRKTDVKDAEWIAKLLRHGLLKASYIPDRNQRELRELVHYRRSIIEERARQHNRIQKVLEGANIKLGQQVDKGKEIHAIVS